MPPPSPSSDPNSAGDGTAADHREGDDHRGPGQRLVGDAGDRPGGSGSKVLWGVRQQGDVAGPLEGHRQLALVAGAGPRLATRLDLRSLREVAAEAVDLLVVDQDGLVGAEGTDLAASSIAVVVVALLGTWRKASGSVPRGLAVRVGGRLDEAVVDLERQVVEVALLVRRAVPADAGLGRRVGRATGVRTGRRHAAGRTPPGRLEAWFAAVARSWIERRHGVARSARSCSAWRRSGLPTGGSGDGLRRRPCGPCAGTRPSARRAGPRQRPGTTRSPPASRRCRPCSCG